MTEKTVCKHLEFAEEEGWITRREKGNKGQDWKRLEYSLEIPPSALEAYRADVDPGEEIVAPEEDEKDGFAEDSWEIKCFDRLIDCLSKNGSLDPRYERATGAKYERLRQAGADEFRKLRELDKHSRDDVAAVLRWVLRPDSWWMENRAFRTPKKMRATNDTNEKYFDVWKNQMEADADKRLATKESLETDVDYSEDVARKLAKKAGISFPDDFWKNGTDRRSGEVNWRVKGEALGR